MDYLASTREGLRGSFKVTLANYGQALTFRLSELVDTASLQNRCTTGLPGAPLRALPRNQGPSESLCYR